MHYRVYIQICIFIVKRKSDASSDKRNFLTRVQVHPFADTRESGAIFECLEVSPNASRF
jgi:hypothetical protein